MFKRASFRQFFVLLRYRFKMPHPSYPLCSLCTLWFCCLFPVALARHAHNAGFFLWIELRRRILDQVKLRVRFAVQDPKADRAILPLTGHISKQRHAL